jgi:hypothetical protein
MDIDAEIDLEQFDNDIIPQQISNTTTASSISSNRELLSKLIFI